MKNVTSRFQSRGGWVAIAAFSFVTGCGSDEGTPPTTMSDAATDAAADTAPRMDASTDAGARDEGSDAVDGTSVPDTRDATPEPAIDRAPGVFPLELERTTSSRGEAEATMTSSNPSRSRSAAIKALVPSPTECRKSEPNPCCPSFL